VAEVENIADGNIGAADIIIVVSMWPKGIEDGYAIGQMRKVDGYDQ
jgi:hypothetical protein